MFTSSFYAVLFLAAANVNAAVTGLKNGTATTSASTASATAIALDPNVMDCFITLPKDPLSATGLSTPFILQPPCSMAVNTQQAFAEAAVYDPATGKISIYHPLVLDSGVKPAAANVVPTLPANAVVGIWFGFNGNTLQLLDTDGKDANASPVLKGANCVNGLPGVQGDIFGQVSWCNAEQWFTAAKSGISAGKLTIPALGNDKNGQICPTSRSFKMTDQDPSDNVPTQYLLVGNATAQDTDANRKALGNGDVINNASDEALLTNILYPIIGCTPFFAPSLDNPGAMVPALALSELQASLQPSPVAFVPKNDPDCLTTAGGNISIDKTNAYRVGVGQPTVGAGDAAGDLVTYCTNLVAGAPPFLKEFEMEFTAQTSPAAAVGNSLFTFLAARYLASLTILTCPKPAFQPVVCQMDANNVATSCVINLAGNSTRTTSSSASPSASPSASSSAHSSASSSAHSSASPSASSSASSSAHSSASSSAHSSASSSTTLVAANITTNKSNGQTTTTINTASTAAVRTTSVSISSTSSAVLAATTSASVVIQVVEVEVVSFFIFIVNLGGALPPSVLSAGGSNGNFIVLEEVFVELAPACQRACNHQFNRCTSSAASPHASFAVSDCKNQENNCIGVASTQTSTPTAPTTVKATATVVHAKNSSATAVTTAATGTQSGGQKSAVNNVVAAAGNGNGNGATMTVTITSVVSQCSQSTVTVTVTASSTTASPSLGLRHLDRHARHRRMLGKHE